MSAVCLERFPVITQEMNSIENEFGQLLSKMELEQSHLSNHELRHLEDLKLAEKRKQEGIDEGETDVNLQTAVEVEDAWEDEREAFTPASRTTEADAKNDIRSVDGKLDRKLILLVKQKLGNSSHWVMPMGPRNEGESMRQAAERVLMTLCGTKLKTMFMGNAPCGFYKYKYRDSNAASDAVGVKVFFFKAQFCDGSVIPGSKDVSDFCWLTKEELDKHLTPKYNQAVQNFILEL